jgi:hypothetical protein
MNMGMRAGLDPRLQARVYATGIAQNIICDKLKSGSGGFPDGPSSKDYREVCKAQLMCKDFDLAV